MFTQHIILSPQNTFLHPYIFTTHLHSLCPQNKFSHTIHCYFANKRDQLAAVAASFRVFIVSLNHIPSLTPNVFQKHILTPHIVKSHSHTLFTDNAFLHLTYLDHILTPYSFWVRCLRESPPMSLNLKPLSVCACQAHDHRLVPHIPCATVITWRCARADDCQSKVLQRTPCYFSTLSRFSVNTLKSSNSLATREASIHKFAERKNESSHEGLNCTILDLTVELITELFNERITFLSESYFNRAFNKASRPFLME